MKIATLAIIERGNEILFGRKIGSPEIGKGTLNGPGGKMESVDKTILDCVIRETSEETGITLNPDKIEKIAIITFYAAGEPSFEVHVYRTSDFTGEPCETESMIPEWHNRNAIPYERMLEADPHFFPQLLRGEKFRTNVYYERKAEGFIKIDPFLPLNDSD
ncbi:MAG: 8-oxo-dGTP diphosphatase [Minisyncoccia bacterium]